MAMNYMVNLGTKKIRKSKMKLSYNKLWKMLIDKNMKRQDLRAITKISDATMAKLTKGLNVNTEVLVRICEALDCDISDIMEIEK